MMKIFDIKIDDKTYTYVDSIHLNDKNYIAYEDSETVYISEYKITEDEDIEFLTIDENTMNVVKEAMGL